MFKYLRVSPPFVVCIDLMKLFDLYTMIV